MLTNGLNCVSGWIDGGEVWFFVEMVLVFVSVKIH